MVDYEVNVSSRVMWSGFQRDDDNFGVDVRPSFPDLFIADWPSFRTAQSFHSGSLWTISAAFFEEFRMSQTCWFYILSCVLRRQLLLFRASCISASLTLVLFACVLLVPVVYLCVYTYRITMAADWLTAIISRVLSPILRIHLSWLLSFISFDICAYKLRILTH